MGCGLTHHVAFIVSGDDAHRRWHTALMEAGVTVTDILDRLYFKSIYFRDPDGHILEIATQGPGFTVDEDIDRLGTGLMLPRWFESRRKEIEDALIPLEVGRNAPEHR